MKNITSTTVCLLLLSAGASAQEVPAPHAALESARLAQEIEFDPNKALAQYQSIAANPVEPDPVRRTAWLRIGRLQGDLGNRKASAAALQKAAEGTDAIAAEARAVLAQEPVDAARALELRQQAEAALQLLRAQIENGTRTGAVSAQYGVNIYPWTIEAENLVWLGQHAVPVLKAELDASLNYEQVRSQLAGTPKQEENGTSGPEPRFPGKQGFQWQREFARSYRAHLASILWTIGDPSAVAYLKELSNSGNPIHSEVVALGLIESGHLTAASKALWKEQVRYRPGHEAELRVAIDSSTIRNPRREESIVTRLEAQEVFDLLNVEVPTQGTPWLQVINRHVQWRPPYESLGLAPKLRKALASTHPGLNQIAVETLQKFALVEPQLRELFLEWVATLPADTNHRLRQYGELDTPFSAREAELATAAMQRLGPIAPRRGRSSTVSNPQDLLMDYMKVVIGQWDHRALPVVLDARVQRYIGIPQIRTWLQSHSRVEDVPTILAAIETSPELADALPYLMKRNISPSAMPYIERLDPILKELDPEGARSRSLVALASEIRHPDAAKFLVKIAQDGDFDLACKQLATLSGNYDSPEVRVALRTLLEMPVEGGEEDVFEGRAAVLHRVMVLGDEAILERIGIWGHYSFAGLDEFERVLDRELIYSQPESPLPWFLAWKATHTGPMGEVLEAERVCKISAASMNRIWKQIYQDDALRERWRPQDFGRHVLDVAPYVDAATYVIIEETARFWIKVIQTGRDQLSREESRGVGSLADLLRYSPKPGQTPMPDSTREMLQQFAEVALQGQLPFAAQGVIDSLAGSDQPNWKEKVLPWVRDHNISVRLVTNLLNAGVQLERAEYDHAMDLGSHVFRKEAIATLGLLAPQATIDWVVPYLADPSAEVRESACKRLGLMLEKEAAPHLLEALGDGNETVRNAAQEALRQIRFYYDEKQRWDRFFDGTAIDAQSAAEALLRQAKPGEAKDQRVIAIRSLGKLGQPEALPFLIEWSKESETATAQAAKAAIDAILAD